MKIDLHLSYPGRFEWSQHGNIHFIGYCFDADGNLYQKAEDWTEELLSRQIETVLGAFAAILIHSEGATVWTDTAASFPIFYNKKDKNITVYNQPKALTHDELLIDTEDFTRIYCTENEHILLPNWKFLLAGHKLHINTQNNTIRTERYFDHFVSEKRKFDRDFEDEFLKITQNWAKQIIEYADGRQIWVPLSGGYDCRLLLSTLILEGAPNIHSYTYGRKESPEIQMAANVAKKLDLDWHFIPYDKQTFSRFFTDHWLQYAMHNHHYHTVPHEQDYFALLELSNKGKLEEDFIAITGHCGEIPAGSVLKSYPIQTDAFIRDKYHYTPKYFIQDSEVNPWDSYHQWLSENRLSKFIVNSLRLFEYFGGRWMLPMWHQDFMQLFYSLEFSERWEEKAYIELCFKHYFEPLGIDLRKPKGDQISASNTYKDFIKALLPQKMVQFVRYQNRGNPIADPCNLHVLYDMLYEYMQSERIPTPERDGDLNRLHAFYMLHLLKSQKNI